MTEAIFLARLVIAATCLAVRAWWSLIKTTVNYRAVEGDTIAIACKLHVGGRGAAHAPRRAFSPLITDVLR